MEDKGPLGRLKHKTTARFLGPERMLYLGLRFGPYGDKFNPFSAGLNLRTKASVRGIDFGPMRPCLIGRLRTSDQRIHSRRKSSSKTSALEHRYARVRVQSTPETCVPGFPIGRRQLRSNNSWLHNSERMVNGKPRCTMLMHPHDAAHRELKSGQKVLVKSRVGSVEIAVEISDEIMAGTVSIPHGWGHNREGIQLSVAEQHAGQSINDLTDDQAIDALCGTAAFSGIPVTVTAMSDNGQF
jgi:anaerobic selenocysteine-containing dehydrogenase